jgi:hypothetical protein
MSLEKTVNSLIQDQFNMKLTVGRLKRDVDALKSELTLGDNITKHQFRNLLTQTQKIVLDNFYLLKDDLFLTNTQLAILTTFKADFDAATSISLSDPLLVDGLNLVASWNLIYNNEPVFTQDDVDRILNGNDLNKEE